MPVTVEITGERRELPVVVDLTAYRIGPESLTNVLRHAGATGRSWWSIAYRSGLVA
ncbi:MAG TPA: hypothetical protein VF755_09845 [Catenuloplanes sp.]